jgi:hypothetical protein
MAFADDLLEQAHHLAHREVNDPKQASLRRAVSTAYYGLFHLLIDDAVGQWSIERQRGMLGRTFQHGKMKDVCDDVCKDYRSGSEKIGAELFTVATAFIQLQQQRHIADYDISRNWTATEVESVLLVASDGFKAWRTIRATDAAQDYLLSLLLPKIAKQ